MMGQGAVFGSFDGLFFRFFPADLSAISAERSGLFYLFAPIKEAFSGSYLCECAKCVEKGFSPVYNSTVTSML